MYRRRARHCSAGRAAINRWEKSLRSSTALPGLICAVAGHQQKCTRKACSFPLTEEKKLLGLPRTFWPKLARSTNCGRELEKRMYRTASAFSLVTAVRKTSQIRHLVRVCLRTPHTWLPPAAQPAPALPRKRAGTSGSKRETREAGCGTQRAATVLPRKIKMCIAFAPPP